MKKCCGFGRTNFGWGAWLALILLVAPSCAKQSEPAASKEPLATQQSHSAELLATAKSGEGQARYVAIDDLGERAEDAAAVVPVLTKLLADKDEQVQWRSARALGDFGEEAASSAPKLQKLLAHENPIFQYHAANALGRIGDRSTGTVDALVTAVGSPDSRVARAAVAAIRNLKPGPQAVHAAIKKAIAAEDHAVAVNALEAIVEIGGAASPLLIELVGDPATAYMGCAAIEQIGPDAAPTVPSLVDLLGKTVHSQLQIQTLLALASIGPAAKSATPQVVTLLESSQDATVPVAAAFALGAIGADDADTPLRAASEKENPFLQMVAAWSLAKIHPDDAEFKAQALEKLNAGFNSDDPTLKAAAEKGLKMLEASAAATRPK